MGSKEKSKKSEERRKARGIATQEEYAAKLAEEALEAGRSAQVMMQKAAEAGSIAAAKIMEAAEVKASIYQEEHGKSSDAALSAHVVREASAALLAAQATQ